MLLDEELAKTLLDESQASGGFELRSPSMMSQPMVHDRITIELETFEHTTVADVKASGLSLRRAMETLNALACCWGFDPDENPAFWRRWAMEQAEYSALFAIERELFSQYELLYQGKASSDSDAEVAFLAAALLPSEVARVRAEVLDLLHQYFRSPPPPVSVTIVLMKPKCDERWRDQQRTMKRLDRVFSLQQDFPQFWVSLDWHSRAYDDRDVEDILALLALSGLVLTEFHAFKIDKNNRKLMEALVRCDSLYGISIWQWPEPTAFFSALPCFRALGRLFLGEPSTTCDEQQWLAYANVSRRLRGLSPLIIFCQFPVFAGETWRAMVQCETFKPLVPEFIQVMMPVVFLPRGTTAVLLKDTEFTTDPFLDDEDSDEAVIAKIDHVVDVVAGCGDRTLVVIPCWGLRWTTSDALSPVPTRCLDIVPVLQGLMCNRTSSSVACDLVASVGKGLTTVFISDDRKDFPTATFATILSRCPDLRDLSFEESELRDLSPLVDNPCAR